MGNLSKPSVPIPSSTTSTTPTTISDIGLIKISDGFDLVVGPNSNGFGIRTVSPAAPANTQGSDGDIWYQV